MRLKDPGHAAVNEAASVGDTTPSDAARLILAWAKADPVRWMAALAYVKAQVKLAKQVNPIRAEKKK